MGKLIKIAFLFGLCLFLMTGCLFEEEVGEGLIRIKAKFVLETYPVTDDNSGVQVLLTGPDVVNLVTPTSGQINVVVAFGDYTVVAGKDSFDSVTLNINASIDGEVRDLGTQILRSSSPPGDPY